MEQDFPQRSVDRGSHDIIHILEQQYDPAKCILIAIDEVIYCQPGEFFVNLFTCLRAFHFDCKAKDLLTKLLQAHVLTSLDHIPISTEIIFCPRTPLLRTYFRVIKPEPEALYRTLGQRH